MNKQEFLNLLWPEEGWRVLAVNGDPFTDEHGDTRVAMRQRAFQPSDMPAVIRSTEEADAEKRNVWFAMATFRERSIVSPRDPNKTGVRFKVNAGWVKTLWVDVDVKPDNPKHYSTKEEAFAAARAFCKATNLPKPLVVDSGGGLHMYWPFTTAVTAERWLPIANHFKQLCLTCGFRIDAVCTSDIVRVLRVPETNNWKKDTPRPVKILMEGGPHDADEIHEKIKTAMEKLGAALTTGFESLGDNTEKTYDGPSEPLHFPTLFKNCAQIRKVTEARGAGIEEPLWYATLGVVRLCSQSERAIKLVSDGDPRYSEAETARKVAQWDKLGPALCSRFEAANPGGCEGCPHNGFIKSPAVVGRKTIEAAPPVMTITDPELETAQIVIELPNPPLPYVRRENGGIVKKARDGDLDEDGRQKQDVVIYENDIYPIRRVYNEITKTEAVVWRVKLPFAGWIQFEIPSNAHSDLKVLSGILYDNGVYPSIAHKPEFQKFMVAYIQQLQKQADTDKVFAKLGWRDDGSFVFNGKQFTPTRTISANINPETATGIKGLGVKGTLEGWQEMPKFYNFPQYNPQAFCFFTGFGSILFKFTGYEGAIVSMVGDTGAGKSTVLQAATSVWGNPKDLMLSGTKQAATVLARIAQISLLNNLPVAIDEVTNLAPEDLSNLCYQISQGKGRVTKGRNSKLQESNESWCTMMACSSNSSIYTKLASLKYNSAAEAMRTFEYTVVDPHVHTMQQADDLLIPSMMENYGVAGEKFAEYVVRNKDKVKALLDAVRKKTIELTEARSPERFWVAIISANIAGALVAVKAGIIPWTAGDVTRVHNWACGQLRGSRAVVKSNVVDPSSIVSEFLNEKVPNTLYVNQNQTDLRVSNIIGAGPRGALLVRVELDTKKVYFNRGEFRKFCNTRGADFNAVKKALMQSGVLLNGDKKATLGKGTSYSSAGQIDCWWIDIANPAIDVDLPETP